MATTRKYRVKPWLRNGRDPFFLMRMKRSWGGQPFSNCAVSANSTSTEDSIQSYSIGSSYGMPILCLDRLERNSVTSFFRWMIGNYRSTCRSLPEVGVFKVLVTKLPWQVAPQAHRSYDVPNLSSWLVGTLQLPPAPYLTAFACIFHHGG